MRSNPLKQIKQLVFGRPLPSERLEHERLDKKTALAVLSSDAISSVAYATDQILFVLAARSGSPPSATWCPSPRSSSACSSSSGCPIGRRVFAYPHGGGSYTVARENLGGLPGLVAAAALLTDYILTVAVSISGGVAAITSAYPALAPHTVLIGALCDPAARDGEPARRARVGRRLLHPDVSSSSA